MQYWKTLAKIVVTCGLVAWLALNVDWVVVGHILQKVSLVTLGIYLALQIAGNFISAVKWQYLARLLHYESFSLLEAFFAYLTGAFINNFLPSTVGGDAYRMLWMSHAGARAGAFAVVVFDRVTGLAALFLFAAFGLSLLPLSLLLEKPGFILLAAIVFSVSFFILAGLFFVRGYLASILAIVNRLPWRRVSETLNHFEPFAKHRPYFISLVFASLFTVVGIGASNYFLFQSLGVHLSLTAFGSAIFVATLVANIPISINNIGVKEWSYVIFFGLVGVSTELAVTAALLSRLLQMLLSFIALPVYLTERRKMSLQSEEKASNRLRRNISSQID